MYVCICAYSCAHSASCPRATAQPFDYWSFSCIRHEAVSKQGSRSKGRGINKPSAGSSRLIGGPASLHAEMLRLPSQSPVPAPH